MFVLKQFLFMKLSSPPEKFVTLSDKGWLLSYFHDPVDKGLLSS